MLVNQTFQQKRRILERASMRAKMLIPPNWVQEVEAELKARGLDVELVEYDRNRTGPFPGVEIFFRGEGAEAWTQALANAPDVKWFHTTSAGVDGIISHTRPRGIILTNSGEVYRSCIGEFVLGLMLYAARRLGEFHDQTRARVWRHLKQSELQGKVVGIIGLGPIGLGVAERAAALGMRIIGARRVPEPLEMVTDVVSGDNLGRLLSESDFVVLACPLTSRTRGMINAAAFAQMKPTAWLINIARGALVDTNALVDALREGRIAGACLDVTDPEPLPPEHPLWGFPNVLITSHCASGSTDELQRRKVELLVSNLERYLSAQPLCGLVDYEREY
jgi:phosphoglycerate dehydrogenase-like enzyme